MYGSMIHAMLAVRELLIVRPLALRRMTVLQAIRRASIITMLFALCIFFPGAVEAQISPGVTQSAAQTATVSGTVLQSDGTPVAGADVRLIGPAQLLTKSDAHGTFGFTSVPYGRYSIVVNSVNLGIATRNAIIVKGDISVAIQYAAQTSGLKTIAEVSTRSAGAQINVTPASIASINPSDYAFQGNVSWQQLLNRIPGVTVGGDLDGGGSDYNAIPGMPFQPVILSINGALPYETSVMLDGMPLINTSVTSTAGEGTNLSYLPMPSFDTADVVRGPGANAPSIVDSIGGSFVLHAPGKVDKNQFEFSVSNDPYGGVTANAKAALRFGRLSATIVYGLNNSPGPFGGTKNLIPSGVDVPLTIDGQAFNGCSPGGPSFCGEFPPNSTYRNAYYLTQTPLLYCCVPVSTAWTQHNGAIGLSYDLTSAITAQVFYAGASSRMELTDENIPTLFAPGSGYTGSIAPNLYIYNQGVVPEPISQASSLLEEKITAYIGHGVLRLAALQNNSFTVQNFPNFCPPNGQYTLWGTGYYASAPNTPANFNGTSAALTFGTISLDENYWVNNRDLLASYALQLGSASHAGVSYVGSYYNYPYECVFNQGSGNFGTTQSPAVSEMTRELRFNAGTELSDKLLLDASWYVTQSSYHVPDPSNATSYSNSVFLYQAPRLGATWRANNNVVVRAAAGGGYALPPISNLVGSNFTDCSSGIYCSRTLTNLNLQPEKSFGFDLGTDMRLRHDTVLSLDLYRVNLYGQFFQSTNLTGMFGGLPLYTTQYNNLSQSRYEGMNVDVRHDVPQGIYWHAALGLTRAYVVSVPSGFYNTPGATCNMTTGVNCTNIYVIPGMNFNGQYQSTVPYANGSMQLGYRWSPQKYIDLQPTYYGKNNTYFEPAFFEFDGHAGYPLTKTISLLATFRNITGVYGQNIQALIPSLAAPTVAGMPYPLYGLPYGPRTVIVTMQFNY